HPDMVKVWKVRAVLFGTFFAYIGVVFSYISPDKVFLFLVNASGGIALLVYLVIAVSHLNIRKKMGRVEQQNLKVKMWFFPYVTYVTIAAIIAVLIAMLAIESLRSQALLTMFVTVLIIISYFIFNRNKNSTVLNTKSKNEESIRF
ncbi:GABA permease, partial [Bacillus sp. B-TM1]